jgi:hypothetical protein
VEKLLKNSNGQWKLIKADDSSNFRAQMRAQAERSESPTPSASTNESAPAAKVTASDLLARLKSSSTPAQEKPKTSVAADKATTAPAVESAPKRAPIAESAPKPAAAVESGAEKAARLKEKYESSKREQETNKQNETTPEIVQSEHDKHFAYRNHPKWSNLILPHSENSYRAEEKNLATHGVWRKPDERSRARYSTIVEKNNDYDPKNDPDSPEYVPGTSQFLKPKYLKKQVSMPDGLAHFEKKRDRQSYKPEMDDIHKEAKKTFSKDIYDHGEDGDTMTADRRDRLMDIMDAGGPNAPVAEALLNRVRRVQDRKISDMNLQDTLINRHKNAVDRSAANRTEMAYDNSHDYSPYDKENKKLRYAAPMSMWDHKSDDTLTPNRVYSNLKRYLEAIKSGHLPFEENTSNQDADTLQRRVERMMPALDKRFKDYEARAKEAEDHGSRTGRYEEGQNYKRRAMKEFLDDTARHMANEGLSSMGQKKI